MKEKISFTGSLSKILEHCETVAISGTPRAAKYAVLCVANLSKPKDIKSKLLAIAEVMSSCVVALRCIIRISRYSHDCDFFQLDHFLLLRLLRSFISISFSYA